MAKKITKTNVTTIEKSEKDIKKVLKKFGENKIDKKVQTIDARNHKIAYDFETYNNLLPKGITIISK
jgi:hypothetical protein